MSKLQVRRDRIDSMNLLDRKYNHKENVVKINSHNTFEHELAKFLLAWELSWEGKEFVTEAIFENGKRADIFSLDDCEAWEVIKSEGKKSLENKGKTYPVELRIFQANKVIRHWFSKLKKDLKL